MNTIVTDPGARNAPAIPFPIARLRSSRRAHHTSVRVHAIRTARTALAEAKSITTLQKGSAWRHDFGWRTPAEIIVWLRKIGELPPESPEPEPALRPVLPLRPKAESEPHPAIVVNGLSVPALVAQALPLLARREVYQRAQQLVHVVRDPVSDASGVHAVGAPRIRALPRQLLINELNAAASWKETTHARNGDREESENGPPREVITTIAEAGEWEHIRPLRGIAHWPVLRKDRSVALRDGYDDGTSYLLCDLPVIKVAAGPTRADAQAAVRRLLALVAEFPFETPAQRAAWLAGVLTLIARPAIVGPVPCIIIDASTPGSGKTLLANLIAAIVTGKPANLRAAPREDSEWHRALLAIALSGAPLVLFDNLRGKVESGALEAVLTSATYSDRKLRSSEDLHTEVQTLFILTANNATITVDLSRRALHCRLVPNEERPELRAGFAIGDLLAYTIANRPALLADAVTILEAYRHAGAPAVRMRPMGSFDAWSATVRAPLIWAGCDDPAETQDALRESASAELDGVCDAGEAWLACFGGEPKTAKEAITAITSDPTETGLARLAEAMRSALGLSSEKPLTSRAVGDLFKSVRDRVLPGGRKISSAGTKQRATLWKVE